MNSEDEGRVPVEIKTKEGERRIYLFKSSMNVIKGYRRHSLMVFDHRSLLYLNKRV